MGITTFDIQSDLINLILSSDKKEVKQICRSITVVGTSFQNLTLNPSVVNCTYRSKSFEHIPEQRKLPDNIMDEFGGPNHKKYFNKIISLFEERKIVTSHLFEGENWAIFFSYQRDIFNTHDPKWKYGAHMHFVSKALVQNKSCGEIWQQLNNRNYKIPNSQHIRYDHDQ